MDESSDAVMRSGTRLCEVGSSREAVSAGKYHRQHQLLFYLTVRV
jgi:hypothetical protein